MSTLIRFGRIRGVLENYFCYLQMYASVKPLSNLCVSMCPMLMLKYKKYHLILVGSLLVLSLKNIVCVEYWSSLG